METLVLTDKAVTPDDDLIFSIIGENSIHWKKLMQAVHTLYPEAQEVWNYYNDGKNWLFRILFKKKTLFWIGVLKDTFRITFYFGDKAESLIDKSELPVNIKDEFKNGKRYGKIRGISIRVERAEDIENAVVLAKLKAMLK
jgi:hypothetical protein